MIITKEEAFMIHQFRNLSPDSRVSILDLLNVPQGDEQIKAIIAAEQVKNRKLAEERKRHIVYWDNCYNEPTKINRLRLVDKNERKKTENFISRIWERENESRAAFDKFRQGLVSVSRANEQGTGE